MGENKNETEKKNCISTIFHESPDGRCRDGENKSMSLNRAGARRGFINVPDPAWDNPKDNIKTGNARLTMI
jgi:hypothetical protein